jgi:glycosyltransferase involved in cell wall biosynthesis
LFEELFAKTYDESSVDRSLFGPLGRRVPGWVQLGLEILRRSDEYDAIVTWAERVTLAVMSMQRLSPAPKPHIAMMYWFSRPVAQRALRAFGHTLRSIVTWSSVQRKYAIEQLNIAPEKIYLVKHFVDQLFWTPQAAASDMICSAGSEMRDYPTLFEALRGTALRCHVATDHVRVDRFGVPRRFGVDTVARQARRAGDGVSVGRKSPVDLRNLYARSRFVVVPLQASDTDNGVSVILEAMAMGKAVICSRTRGQVDVIEDGVTGLFVPVGDSEALRAAIVELWGNPERAAAMGRAARAAAEKHHTLEKFCADVRRAIDASLDGVPARPDGSIKGA